MLESTDIGHCNEQILKDLEEQVQVSVAAGAKILTGGQKFKAEGDLARGNFYEPTVLVDIPKGSPAYQEEIFRPRSPRFFGSLTSMRQLRSPTPHRLVLVQQHGRTMKLNALASSKNSKPGAFLSTVWSLLIRVCRLAA